MSTWGSVRLAQVFPFPLRPLTYFACNTTDRDLLLSVSLDTRLLIESAVCSSMPVTSGFALPLLGDRHAEGPRCG